MRPVNQAPLSLNEMNRSPLASSRNPDSPPKPGNRDVKASPLRYSSDPKRTRVRSLRSNEAIGRALTSIETGADTEYSSGAVGFGGGSVAACALAIRGTAMIESPATPDIRKRRRVKSLAPRNDNSICSGMQAATAACLGWRSTLGLVEQLGELFGDGAAEFFGIDDGDRTTIIACDIMADADRDQFDRRAGFDFLDNMAQMALQIIAGIDRQRGVVDRRAVGNHHQDLALLGAPEQPLVRPVQRFAVDVLLEQTLAHHQPEILSRAPPRRVGGF